MNRPLCMVSSLPLHSDLINLLYGLQCVLGNIPIISLRPVSLPLKLKCRILDEKTHHYLLRNALLRTSARGDRNVLTCVMSFPCNRRYAFVHFTLRGFLFILKFLWHFDLQNLKIWRGKWIVVMKQYRVEKKRNLCHSNFRNNERFSLFFFCY